MVLITIVTGAYKPTYNWGASHCGGPHIVYVYIYIYTVTIDSAKLTVCELENGHL